MSNSIVNPHRSRSFSAPLLGTAMLLAPYAAYAGEGSATNADDLDRAANSTIVVTGVQAKVPASATKTATPLIEIPLTVTVVDADELTRRNALSLNQVMGYVAGASPNQRGAMVTRYDQFILRGFTPAIFLDGMRLLAGPYSMPQIDFNRIDQVDIIKGPASVLYGNATPGGVVNMTSKLPQEKAAGRFEAQLGNYATRRITGDINQPLDAQGKLLARVVGGWQKGDGLTSGTFSERYHISPSLTFSPTPRTSLTLLGAYQHAPSGGGYSGVPAYGTVLANPFGTIARNINTGDPAYERYNHKARSLAGFLHHEFSDAIALRSNLRYQHNTLSYRQLYVAGFATTGTGTARNSDYSTVTRGGGGADENFKTITADNNLTAKFTTLGAKHTLLVGGDFQQIAGENYQQFNTGVSTNPLTSIPTLNLFAPSYGGTMPSFDLTVLSSAYTNTYSKREQWGVYVQDQVALGRLQLIAAGRQDWYRQDSFNKKNGTASVLSQKAFTGRLGALYAMENGLSPFISFSQSFEPQTGTTWQGTPFVPVTGRQFEAGLKWNPKGTKAVLTLSAYDLRRQKVPVTDPQAGTAGIPSSSQIQIGEVRVRGIEFEGRGDLGAGFDIIAAASLTDAIITQGAPAIAATSSNSGTPSTTGTRQLGTPKWAASAFVTYDFDKGGAHGALAGLRAGGGLRYVGGSDGTTTYAVINGVTTFQRFSTKDFTLVDAMVSYDLGRAKTELSGWTLAINVANLFDKTHISACPFNNSCYYGAPRTVTGTLRYSW